MAQASGIVLRPSFGGSSGIARSTEPSPPDFAQLTVLAMEGRSEATTELLRAVAPAVRRCCKAIMGASHADLEDAVQDSLMAFVRALQGYRFECGIPHYAIRIALRVTHALRRRSMSWRDRFHLTADVDDEIDAVSASVSEEAVSAQRREALRKALGRLPREQSEALTLRFCLEYSMLEVASITGAPLNTVKTRLRLGREALRRHIDRDPVLHRAFGGNRD
jgi:RNA polymerase sigma-70 factor, ECF subfamily